MRWCDALPVVGTNRKSLFGCHDFSRCRTLLRRLSNGLLSKYEEQEDQQGHDKKSNCKVEPGVLVMVV